MNIITREYEGHTINYQEDGWFNATQAASKYDKEPTAWLRQADTVEYISALANQNGNSGFVTEFNKIKNLDSTISSSRNKLLALAKKTGYVKAKAGSPENGGGTWLHPKLAVTFARWLDVYFAVWCDSQIDSIIRETDDWRKLRHSAASGYKVVSGILKLVREDQGKATETHHYSNEARLINWALSGKFDGIDRNLLSGEQLNKLAYLQERNAVLIGRGMTYEQRKPMLKQYAMDWSMPKLRSA